MKEMPFAFANEAGFHSGYHVDLIYDDHIRKISPDGIIISVAGKGAGDQGRDYVLSGLTLDPSGSFYFSNNNLIRKVTPAGEISIIAGNGTGGDSGDGGQAASAQLNGPAGLAIDSAGNLFIADTDNHRIRKVAADKKPAP
jgi:trimeric autotransporter adhesin